MSKTNPLAYARKLLPYTLFEKIDVDLDDVERDRRLWKFLNALMRIVDFRLARRDLSDTPYNTLPNGNFEQWSGGVPIGVTVNSGAVAQTTARPGAYVGSYAMQVQNGDITITLPFQPGQKHQLAMWFKLGQGATGTITFTPSGGATNNPRAIPLAATRLRTGWVCVPGAKVPGEFGFETASDHTGLVLNIAVTGGAATIDVSDLQWGPGIARHPALWSPCIEDLQGCLGDFDVPGKLTVGGLIDPTGLVLDEKASVPGGTPSSGKATLWVKSDANPTLHLTDDAGNDTRFGASTIATIVSATAGGASAVSAGTHGFTSPEASDFTAINSAGLSDVDTYLGSGVAVNAPSSGSTGTMRMKGGKKSFTYSSGTITLTACMLVRSGWDTYIGCGLFFRESSTGKITFWNVYSNVSAIQPALFGAADLSGYDGSVYVRNPTGSTDQLIMPPGSIIWFRLTYDGSNIVGYYSVDGVNWKSSGTVSKTEYFTTAPDEWGFFANANSPTQDIDITLVHWAVT